MLRETGLPFADVCQDDLPPGHPQRGYTSPTILAADGRALWGSASGEAGCSVLPGGADALRAALKDAGVRPA